MLGSRREAPTEPRPLSAATGAGLAAFVALGAHVMFWLSKQAKLANVDRNRQMSSVNRDMLENIMRIRIRRARADETVAGEPLLLLTIGSF